MSGQVNQYDYILKCNIIDLENQTIDDIFYNKDYLNLIHIQIFVTYRLLDEV